MSDQGRGRFVHANGDVYEGQWLDDKARFFWANCVMVSKPPKDDHPAFTVRQHDQSRPSRLHVLVPIHPTKALRVFL